MPVALGLPTGYPYVLAVATGSIFLNLWQTTLVSLNRKRAGIKYPQVYATKDEEASSKDAKIFNCAQRAHQNTLESSHWFILNTLIAGFRYPRVAVAFAALHLIGRVFYTLGYTTGDPAKRVPGSAASTLAQLGLLGTSTFTIFQFLSETDFQL